MAQIVTVKKTPNADPRRPSSVALTYEPLEVAPEDATPEAVMSKREKADAAKAAAAAAKKGKK